MPGLFIRMFILSLGVFTLWVTLAQAAAPPKVGTISITREVLISLPPGKSVYAKQGQNVLNGQKISTLKRSRAEIKFLDGSIIRINERTDLLLRDVTAMKRIRLDRGAVWVQVAKDSNTTVETPTATATAKGTIFIVMVLANGATRVIVFDSAVEVTSEGETTTVQAGQSLDTTGGGLGSLIKIPGFTPSTSDSPGTGSAADTSGWWGKPSMGDGTISSPGSDDLGDVRDSPLGEPPPAGSPWFIADSQTRATFLNYVQDEFAPSISGWLNTNPGSTLDDYVASYGNLSINWYEPSGGAMTFMTGLGVNTVSDLIAATLANGGTIYIYIDGGEVIGQIRQRSMYRAGAVRAPVGTPELALIDRTETSLSILAVGLGLSLLADSANLHATPPEFGGMLFGFINEDDFLGGRGILHGKIGRTEYALESNVLRVFNSPLSDAWESRLDSVAVVKHPLAEDWTIFAGRDRFYAGPVFQNRMNTQLISNRYSGVGIETDRKRWALQAAWLYDSNPELTGAQRGALASLLYRAGGGVFGAHLLEATKITPGHGRTASFSYPLFPHKLDIYGEVGISVDDAPVQTYGIYFPEIYQRHDIDLFLEYGTHKGVGQAYSIVGCKKITDAFEARLYTDVIRRAFTAEDEIKVGAGLIWRFGAAKQQ
ncbi:MAG: FecR family protein [Armatimonadota bacterium]